MVVDASVLANVIADDGTDGDIARAEVAGSDGMAAPDLVDVETAAVLRKRWLAGALSDRRYSAALDDLEALEIDRYPGLAFVRWAFELRANVTAYDAAYVALAEALDCELVTADRRLQVHPVFAARSAPFPSVVPCVEWGSRGSASAAVVALAKHGSPTTGAAERRSSESSWRGWA